MNTKYHNKRNNLLKSLEPLSTPSLLNCFIYLLIPLFIFLTIFKTTKDFLPHIDMLYIKFLISLFGVTYAYKDLSPYIKNVNNFKTTIKISIKLFIAYILFLALAILIVGHDPQNIQNLNLSNSKYFRYILELPFTAIGEEVLKALMLLALIRLFKPLKNIKFIAAILISSAVFGLLHVNYNYATAMQIIFAIGFTTIPDFIFFLYYKSIYPLIIIHFITDFVTFSKVSENFQIFFILFQVISMLLIIIWMLKSMFIKK